MAFLGDMFEVGPTTQKEHKEIADTAAALEIDEIHLVGSNFKGAVVPSDSTSVYANFEEFKETFGGITSDNATILIKGSRGMAMERILPLI